MGISLWKKGESMKENNMVFKTFCNLNIPHIKKIVCIFFLSLLLTVIYIISPVIHLLPIVVGKVVGTIGNYISL